MFVWTYRVSNVSTPENAPLIPEFTIIWLPPLFWQLSVGCSCNPVLFICGFVTGLFSGTKGFCTYACLNGGVFGLADNFAWQNPCHAAVQSNVAIALRLHVKRVGARRVNSTGCVDRVA